MLNDHLTSDVPTDDDLRPEYRFDYTTARPNRFAPGATPGRLVLLDPDIAAVFPSAESVNTILRALITTLPRRTHEPAA